MESEVRKTGYTGQEIVTLAQRRIRWRALIDGPCSQRVDGHKKVNLFDVTPGFFISRVPSHTTHTSRALFSSHVRVLTSSSISPCIPSGGRWMGQRPLVIWSAVCSERQSQQSLVGSPQRSIFAPNLPTPVRGLFSRVQARRDRSRQTYMFKNTWNNSELTWAGIIHGRN